MLGCGPVAAQVLWSKLVSTPARRETGKFMTPVTGGFVMVGETQKASFDLLYLSKVNYVGDTLWTRRIRFPTSNGVYARGVIEDRAGNLVVSATVFNSTVTPSQSWGGLAKLTPTGDTLWTRLTGNGINTLVLGNDGNYVLASDVKTTPLGTIPTLFKYSPAGAVVWSHLLPYDNTRMGYLSTLVAVPNGYLVESMPNYGGLRSKLISVNELGVYQQERLSGPAGAGPIRLDSDGNLIGLVNGGLAKFTTVGDTIWTRPYRLGNSLRQGLARVVELPNGNYLSMGSWYNGYDMDVTVQLFSHQGVLLRDTLMFRGGANETPVGVGFTPAGNYLLAASTDTYLINNPSPIYAHLWFCLRSWARLLPTRPSQPAPQNRVFAYPNPTANDLTLVTADEHVLVGRWALLDLLGREMQTGTLAGLDPARLSLAGLPAGCYLLRVHDERRNTEQTLRIERH
ncbi:hypothetical protein GCM10028822_16880 [Hymenobacter terrigena]